MKTKKKSRRNLVLSSAGISDLLKLPATFSCKYQARFLLERGGLNLDEGTLTLDGRTRPPLI